MGLVNADDLYIAIVKKGQASKRYKIGEMWELNGEEIREVIDAQPIIEPPFQWIPCKEKMPPNVYKIYWVCTDNGIQCECRWTNDIYGFGEIDDRWDWSYLDKPRYSTIVAWRELPEPYKENDGTN